MQTFSSFMRCSAPNTMQFRFKPQQGAFALRLEQKASSSINADAPSSLSAAPRPSSSSPFSFGPLDTSLGPAFAAPSAEVGSNLHSPFLGLGDPLTAFQLDGGVGNGAGKASQVEPQVSAFTSKTFDEDLLGLPFDLSEVGSDSHSSFDILAFPLTSSVYTSFEPPSVISHANTLDVNPFALDNSLESPLGLGDDSPFSQYLASPLFGSEGSLAPSPHLQDYSSLFPVSLAPPPTPALVPFPAFDTALRPNPPPPTQLPSLPSPTLTSIAPTAAPTPAAAQPKSKSTTAKPPRRGTGFRGPDSTLVPLDAPVQPRIYAVESSTSRKRKTSAIERGLAKRGRASASPDVDAALAADVKEGEAIPDDLASAAERKRLQNTLSARKSRARKQERVGELEERNRELVSENEGLKARLERMEAVMKSLGMSV